MGASHFGKSITQSNDMARVSAPLKELARQNGMLPGIAYKEREYAAGGTRQRDREALELVAQCFCLSDWEMLHFRAIEEVVAGNC